MDRLAARKGRAIALTETATGLGVASRDALKDALDRFLATDGDSPFVAELVSQRLVDGDALEAMLQGAAPTEDGAPPDPRSTEDAPAATGTAVVVKDRASAQLQGDSTIVRRPGPFEDDAPPPAPPARYRHEGLLGKGGMGEVHDVKDVDLNRSVALKRVRPDRLDARARAQFLQEAQITAQLEHPNIPPIHDIGRLAGGDPFFTMKRVEGTTLRTLLARVQAGDRRVAEKYDAMRLAIVFLQVAQAVAYAHARGVVHCDLKPENVLVGRHGEVLVMDWGLAQLVDAPAGEDALPPVTLTATDPLHAPGAGTLHFMSPEQLSGDAVDARSDVYALGAILYEILGGKTPYDATSRAELLILMFTEGPVPPSERAATRVVPPDLEAIAMKALAPRAGDRYARADDVAEAVEQYLTGARRRKNAEARFAEGEAARARLEAAKARRAALRVERGALREMIKPYDDESIKAPLWTIEDALAAAELDVERAVAEALDRYGQAVGLDEGFAAAAARLADLHVELFVDAEERGDTRAAAIHRSQVERHHRGRHADVLDPRGRVTIAPVDDGVVVRGVRLRAAGKRIVEGDALPLHGRPPDDLELPAGSYVFTASRRGMRDARLHVRVGRGTRTTLRPRLYDDAAIGAGFVHVPAGPFVYGGDPDALNAAPRAIVDVDDFAIAEHPTTCAEYLEFLNDDPQRNAPHVPRTKPDGGSLWSLDDGGRYALPPIDADGNPVHPRAPVMGVSYVDATTYAAWRSKRDGVAYRLPTEIEWEKAARGADGRFFPWGDGFDPTFCKMALSRPGRPQPEPVGAFPVDVSVYGMRDAAGSIREWCDSWFDETKETRVLRGGAWYFNAAYCRVAFRHGYLPHIVFTNFGIRLAKSL